MLDMYLLVSITDIIENANKSSNQSEKESMIILLIVEN
jgi:hypothetical protein